MTRKYKKSPIVEVVCEFQFTQDSEWALVMPGLIYERVKGTFPVVRPAKQVNVEFTPHAEGLDQQVRTSDRAHFLKKNGKALMQVGPRLLAINHLKPYPSWEKFLPLIKKAFQVYRKIANPKGLHRIVLRYINHVDFPRGIVELSDYFDYYPYVGDKLPENYFSFLLGTQFLSNDAKNILKIELANASSPNPKTSRMVLDLSYVSIEPESIELDYVFDWVEFAHTQVENAFEACIKNTLRHMFGEVTE